MARKPKKRRPAPDEPMEQIAPRLLNKLAAGTHVHVAEVYGYPATVGLTRWARRAVLSG